ncbi:retinol dehydrogenase 11 [Phlebotomus argentipes]|uniref:retinol dehydrogenase 11 n=1 Tax=Phlebotomus argentipes TaxID=94469 RepID=UPI002893082C|nr:retinol dehydrogenase 11 [Phlebotomus argentipes]
MDQIKEELIKADPLSTWWPYIAALVVGIIVTVRAIMGGQRCPSENKIDGLVVVMTGGTGGIGWEVCKELCARSGHVILAVRNMEKAEKMIMSLKKVQPNAKIEANYMDLKSFDCVRRFVKTLETKCSHIDILINNAGLMFHPYELTADGFEMHLQCNYLGHFLLTMLTLPLLQKSRQGRIVNVSAHAHTTAKMDYEDPLNIGPWAAAYHPRDAFAHAKLASILTTRYLATRVLHTTNVTANSLTPGLVRGTGHLDSSPIMRAICAKVITYPWMWLFMKTPSQGAQTAIYLATEPKLKAVSGKFFNDCEIVESSELSRDDKLAEKLVKESLKAVKIEKN